MDHDLPSESKDDCKNVRQRIAKELADLLMKLQGGPENNSSLAKVTAERDHLADEVCLSDGCVTVTEGPPREKETGFGN